MQSSSNTFDYCDLFKNLAIPYIVFRANDELTIVEQNDAHVTLNFSTRKEIIGKPLSTAFPDNSPIYLKTGVNDLIASLRKVISTKKLDIMPKLRYDVKDKTGKLNERWWQLKNYPIFDKNGNVQLIYQLTEDITETIKAQQEADSILSQLTSALEIGMVSTWAWDVKNDLVTGDKNLARNFGINYVALRQGMPISAFFKLIHPDDRQRVSDAVTKAIATDTVFSEHYRTINNKGRILWVKSRGKMQYTKFNDRNYFTGVLIDITDRKEAELRLAQREQEYSALFNSTIVAIAKADTSGNILQVNKTFLRMFGYSAQEFKRGLTSAQVTQHKNDQATVGIYETLRTFGESDAVKKEYRRKDGSTFTGLVGAATLPGSKDTFIAFIVDVTENEQLKELNNAKDDFVALASHQLRSPATVVKQYLGVLLSELAGGLNEDQVQYLNVANNANNRQLTIIDDLLKTVQIDTKGYAITLQPINFAKTVKDIVEQYESMFDSRKQTVDIKIADESLVVRVDESEIVICIANILENASKYSASGQSISVSLTKEARKAVLTVEDHGVGIAKKNHDKIFEKFTRIDNELSDTVSGSGLGLFWVKRIVEIHGGRLSLTSKLGKGTKIVVKLPL